MLERLALLSRLLLTYKLPPQIKARRLAVAFSAKSQPFVSSRAISQSLRQMDTDQHKHKQVQPAIDALREAGLPTRNGGVGRCRLGFCGHGHGSKVRSRPL